MLTTTCSAPPVLAAAEALAMELAEDAADAAEEVALLTAEVAEAMSEENLDEAEATTEENVGLVKADERALVADETREGSAFVFCERSVAYTRTYQS